MRGATDPVTSLDSGRPASAPGATDVPPITGLQAPLQEEEEEMGRRGRGRGKTRRKHVNEEQESDASSARASGPEEADDEAEESESYRAKAAVTTKKRKRDRTENKNVEGEAPVGGDQSIISRKLEDAEEDYSESVLHAPLPEKCDTPAAVVAQEEGEKGEDVETDGDILSLGDSKNGLTMQQIDSWFEEQRIKRLAKERADCRIEGVDDEEGDMEEDTETDDNLSFLGESSEEEVVDTKKDGDVSLGGERREEEGKRKNMDLDDILSQSESEEETADELKRAARDESHRSMERDMGPKRMELVDATWGWLFDIPDENEGEKGEDVETDDDILSLGDSENGLTMQQIDSWFEEQRIKRLAKERANCRIEGVDDEEGDMEEDTETDDNLSFLGESSEEEVVDTKKDGDVSLGGERREEEGKRKNRDLDDILSQSESEEEMADELKRAARDELHRSMERDMGPKRMELIDATWGWLFDIPDENEWKGPKGKDAKGEESWKEFHDLYASRLITYYGYAKQAESNDWPTRVQDWPSDFPNALTIGQKRREIERLEEIKRVSNFCLLLVTRKPYIKHNSDIGDLLKCLENDGIIPLRVSTTLIIGAIQFLKNLLFNVEYFFHPLIREGYTEFLKLAVNMHFRMHRHELEEYYERTRIESFGVLFPYLDRAIERRKNESKEARQVALHNKFDEYIASSDFEKEAQNKNFSITPKILAEEFEIVKRDFKDLNMELIKVSLAERCLIIKLCHHIGAYAKHFTELLKNNQERSQFAEIVNEIIEGSNDVLVDHKLSQMLPVIHEKYFSTVPEYYAVQGIMHYLELSSSNKDNKKLDYEELLSSWCLEKCNFINWLWRRTRSYDEKPHNAMRQPFMAGISIWK